MDGQARPIVWLFGRLQNKLCSRVANSDHNTDNNVKTDEKMIVLRDVMAIKSDDDDNALNTLMQ